MAENYFGLTDTGRVRSNNEDAFLAQRIFDNRLVLACVIDGVGGYEGGEVAAAIAKETIIEIFTKESPNILSQMRTAFATANERIGAAKQAGNGNDSMACVLTLAIVDLEKNQFYYAHVGDTRLYLFRDASLVKVSKDHSFVGFLEDTGRLSEEAAMQHPKRNEINKALGFGGTITNGEEYIETDESPFLPGDLLLLCSDGLTDMVNKSTITALLAAQSSLEEKAVQLVAAANENGGKDNITVALVYHDKAPLKQKATKPAALKKNENLKTEREAVSSVAPEKNVPVKSGGRTNTVLFLSTLSMVLMLGLGWAIWKLWSDPKQEALPGITVAPKNENELRLQQLIDHSTSDTITLSDSVFAGPIVLTDTVFINRPALYLKGGGDIIVRADTAFRGPAFVVPTNNQRLILDSMLFENFQVVIAAQHKNIVLRNTRFNQCNVSVASYLSFPEVLYISGLLSDTTFSADSIPKPLR